MALSFIFRTKYDIVYPMRGFPLNERQKFGIITVEY